MTKKNIIKQIIKDCLDQGPMLSSEIRKILDDTLKYSEGTLDEAKKELNIKSYQSNKNIWYWYDPSIKMGRREIANWLESNNSDVEPQDEDTDELSNQYVLTKQDGSGTKKVEEFYENPYEWLEDNSIYYFDYEDDFEQLTNYSKEWGQALRRKPQRIETFKQLAELDVDNLPPMLDTDGSSDEALIWMIKENNWIEEAKSLIEQTKDKKYKTQLREDRKEDQEHLKEFVNYWGYSYIPQEQQ